MKITFVHLVADLNVVLKMPSNLYAGTHFCRLSMYSLGAKQCIPFPDGQGTCKIFVALG